MAFHSFIEICALNVCLLYLLGLLCNKSSLSQGRRTQSKTLQTVDLVCRQKMMRMMVANIRRMMKIIYSYTKLLWKNNKLIKSYVWILFFPPCFEKIWHTDGQAYLLNIFHIFFSVREIYITPYHLQSYRLQAREYMSPWIVLNSSKISDWIWT